MEAVKFTNPEIGKAFTFINEVRLKINKLLGNFVTKVSNAVGSDTPTVNGEIGTITSSALTTAAAASQAIVVTNSKVKATSIVFAQVVGYAGAGNPIIEKVTSVVAGAFTVSILNVDQAAANLDAAVKIHYIVF